MNPELARIWQDAERAFAEGRAGPAQAGYEAIAAREPRHAGAWLRLSALAGAAGRHRASVLLAERAAAVVAGIPALRLQVAARLLDVGESRAARVLFDAALAAGLPPGPWPAEAAFLAHRLDDHAASADLCRRALRADPRSPALLALLGTALTFLGRIDEAEAALEDCIRAAPGLGSAHWTLSKLRRWSPQHNHLPRLRQLAATLAAADPAMPYVQYALFKELEDCGRDAEAWEALARGAASRRREVRYDPLAEHRLFAQLAARCDAAFLRQQAAADGGAMPIFIVGQPRSGTTLLERILGAHPAVRDAGELQDFPFQLAWACDHQAPGMLDEVVVQRAGEADYAEMGRRYLERTRWRAQGRPFYTDKLPRNFMQLGFIHKALPGARILHMVRDPMDTCFSNLKELFGAAYPHSYDMADMAAHYRNYAELMRHWREVLPGRFLDVSYEALVTDPEAGARRVLAFCGLDWEPACLAIEARQEASATASTVQVREPIHARNVAQWRRYASQLEPLRRALGEPAQPG
jgi:tetratricopeptide (TPR) repeat protein